MFPKTTDSMTLPKVFIVLVNWNDYSNTIECVSSCKSIAYPNFDIIVVDNGSTDDSLRQLQLYCPEIVLIPLKDNFGFAYACNVGIKHVFNNNGHYVWLLNNDTTVDPMALTEMLHVFDSDPTIGMVGSKILNYQQPHVIEFAGGLVSLSDGQTQHVGVGETDAGQFDRTTETQYITGCSILTSKPVVEKIGYMTEDYFLYYEDADWCVRARSGGFILAIAPQSKVYHKVSSSAVKVSGAMVYYMIRNRLYFLERNGHNVQWFARIRTDLRDGMHWIRHRDPDMRLKIKCLFKGYLHWLFGYTGPVNSLSKDGFVLFRK
jgi:GT2 family glycosyltransferase